MTAGAFAVRMSTRWVGRPPTRAAPSRPSVGSCCSGRIVAARSPTHGCSAGLFAGTDGTTILDTVDIDAPLPGVVDDAVGFIDRHLATSLVIAGVRHHRARPVPAVAVREAACPNVPRARLHRAVE